MENFVFHNPTKIIFGRRTIPLIGPEQDEQDGNLAAATGECLRHWLKDIGAPCSLTDLGIGPEHFTAIAENAQALAKVWRLREYTVGRICTILERCVLSEQNEESYENKEEVVKAATATEVAAFIHGG